MGITNLTDFGVLLRKHRIDQKMTMMSLAGQLGVTPAYLSNVESGRKVVTAHLIESITQAMHLSPEQADELTLAASKQKPDVTLRPEDDFEAHLALMFARRLGSKNIDRDALLKALELKP